jgi:lipopolysaccharide/colanic/teichoic acid biosynthesis glycosyltransferase
VNFPTSDDIRIKKLSAKPKSLADYMVLSEEAFHKTISIERKRTERSRKPFLLMLLDTAKAPAPDQQGVLSKLFSSLQLSTRETDVTGWYKHSAIIGVMFTEIGNEERNAIVSTMITRVSATLRDNLSFEEFNQISISFYLFPEDWDPKIPQRSPHHTLYPDLQRRDNARKHFHITKRVMDVVGSSAALLVLAPLFLLISAAIKLTSKGPVFYRQPRIGRHGVPFVCLKFRSMYLDSDSGVHESYVRDLIAGRAQRKPHNGNGPGVYKLTEDSRITPLGSILRRTSLDELPQFLNVLRGDMSLVGPRPPIPYEVEAYDIWHRRRLLEAKPGITGLWQVNGRSRVAFDEMVRLDLRYAQSWSPWLDLKILLRTPWAVVIGEGAH